MVPPYSLVRGVIDISDQYITISEAARRAEISRAAMRKHLKVGRVLSKDGKIEVVSFNSWLASKQDRYQNIELLQSGVIPYGEASPIFATRQEAELYKASYEARLRQIEYDKELETVVKVEDVVSALSLQLSAIRTRLLAIPAEMAPQIFNCKTVAETQGKMHQLMVRALEELSEDERWIKQLQERENNLLESTTERAET